MRSKVLTVRVTEDVYLRIAELACDEGEDVAVLLRRALRMFIDRADANGRVGRDAEAKVGNGLGTR